LLSRSWVKVKRHSKLRKGQSLCHSALRRYLVSHVTSPLQQAQLLQTVHASAVVKYLAYGD